MAEPMFKAPSLGHDDRGSARASRHMSLPVSAPRERKQLRSLVASTHMQQHYELLLLIDAQAADRDLESVLANVRATLKKIGGSVTKEEPLGKRKLAYAIRKQKHGAYHVLEFDASTRAIDELDRTLRLTPEVLRHLVVIAKIRTAEELEREEAIRAKIEARRRAAQVAAQPAPEAAPAPAAGAPAPEPVKVSLEQLDKKLEHILEETPDV